MFNLADWPIRRKLRFLTASVVSIALALACLAFSVYDVQRIRSCKAEQITALADILGFNATTSLEFGDADTAREVLSSLNLQPSIDLAALFDADGQLVATYPAEPPSDHPIPTDPQATNAVFGEKGHLLITQDIRRDGEMVGTIHIASNLDEINRQLARTVWIGLGVMAVALSISMLIAGRLQRLFTKPIDELAKAIGYVSAQGDYALHVQKHGDDELGVLCDGFNTMMDQIEVARDELQYAHDKIEKRVIQRTAELQVALDIAEEASHAKSDFLANMSHEIRTPMTAILGYADILAEEEDLSDVAQEHLTAMRRNGKHLLTIINDILDLSKIEAGKMTVERIDCSPCRLIDELTSLMRRRATEKGLSFDLVFYGRIPETICTDPTRLRQVLVNLIGNAIKFTHQGGIRLAVSMFEPGAGREPRLCLEVIDTGVGMSREQIDEVFEAFTQADETMTRRFGGTGLGLTISKALVEMLGGTLEVESQPGQGSTFRVTVETGSLEGVRMLENCREALVETAAAPVAERQASAKLSARVLLCEDGPDNQRVIAFLLRKAGADVTVADNGQIGLDKVAEAQEAGKPFDVILMDMQMPVLDGYGATRRLRQEGYQRPIIALTAHAMAEDRQKCLDAGCDDYATKPIQRQQLISLVARHLPSSEEAAAATPCDKLSQEIS